MTETVMPPRSAATVTLERQGGRTPGPIDVIIGQRIRALRLERGLSQDDLAKEVGISAQQMHKYETAHNRISAAMLFMVSRPLGVSAAIFFEDMEDGVESENRTKPHRTGRRLRRFPDDTNRPFRRGRRSVSKP